MIATTNGGSLTALEVPALKVINHLGELALLVLFQLLEFESEAVKTTLLVVFDPFDFGLFHEDGIVRLIMVARKYDADIINPLVFLQYRSAYELEIVLGQNPINAAKADVDQVNDAMNFFQFEMHLGPGQGFYPEISATLQPLDMLGEGYFQALLA